MFGLGVEVLEASCPTSSLSACVLDHGKPDLLIIKGHSIEIYRMNETTRLYGIFKFSSRIIAAESIPQPDSQPDHLMLFFPDCKVSVVRFSKKIGDFVTVSLHSYENQELLLSKEPDYDVTSCVPIDGAHIRRINVDPEGRCALIRLNSGNWALHGFAVEAEEKPASLIFSSRKFDDRIRSIVDFVFLEGFFEPTLAITYEISPSWPAQSAVRKDTLQLVVLTLNLQKGEFTPIYHSTSGLPSEARRLQALSKSVGGFLLQGPNLFIHADHVGNFCYFPLNPYAYVLSNMVKNQTTLSLVSARNFEMIQNDSGIWTTTDGDWYWLKFLKGGAGRGVTSMVVEAIADINLKAHTFTLVRDRLFASSLRGNHGVYELEREADKMVEDSLENLYGDEEMDSFYISTTPSVSLTNSSGKVKFSLIQPIASIGPVCDFVITEDRIIAIGDGHVTEIFESIPTKSLTSFELKDAQRLHVISGQFLVVSTSTSSMLLALRADGGMTEVEQTSFFLESPTILASKIGDSLVQVTRTHVRVLTSDATMLLQETQLDIESAVVFENRIICLLHGGSLCLVNIEGQIEDFQIVSPAKQISASSHLSVLHNNGALSLYSNSFELIFHNKLFSFLPQVLQHDLSSSSNFDHQCGLESTFVLSDDVLMAVSEDQIAAYRMTEDQKMVKISGINSFAIGKTVSMNQWGSKWILVGTNMSVCVSVASDGFPRIHPFTDSVASMTGFSENQLVSAQAKGQITLHSVETELSLELPLPHIHRSFDFDPRLITYNASNGTFGLVASEPESYVFPDDEYCAIADNPEWKPPIGIDSGALFKPTIPRMTFHLMDKTCKLIDSYRLDTYERVTSLQTISLATKENETGRKPFFVLGVPSIKGEDRPVRGRILIFDVVNLVGDTTENGEEDVQNNLTQVQRLKLLTATEIKTPISSICGVNGLLSITGGVKTILYEFEDNESLTGVAFVDAGVYVTSSCAAKGNLLCLADAGMRGLGLFGFQEKPPKLVELAWSPTYGVAEEPIYHVDCMINNTGRMVMVGVGADGKISFWSYAPLSPEGGNKLVLRGIYRVDGSIVRLHRFLTDEGHVALAYMTADGALGILRPLDETQFRKLHGAQSRMIEALPHPAGLHPRAARGLPPNRQWIDGDFLRRVHALPRMTQARLQLPELFRYDQLFTQ